MVVFLFAVFGSTVVEKCYQEHVFFTREEAALPRQEWTLVSWHC